MGGILCAGLGKGIGKARVNKNGEVAHSCVLLTTGKARLLAEVVEQDIITTKPFEIDADKALEVLEEAKILGRIVQMNSPSSVLSDELIQIKKWQKEYQLGQPVGCRCDVWVSYHEKADGTWYDDAEKCPAAPIFRLGIYLINDLVRLLGKADKVQVLTSKIQTGRLTPDNAQLGILFKNGAVANISASFETALGNPEQGGGLQMAAVLMMKLVNHGVAAVIANYLNPREFGIWENEQLRIFGTRGFVEAVDGGAMCRLVVQGEKPCEIQPAGSRRNYFEMFLDELLVNVKKPLTIEDELHPTRIVIKSKMDIM